MADGWHVLAVDLEPDPSGPGDGFAADLATREGNRAAVDATVERFGGIDAVVANAGFQHVAAVEEFDEDRWDALIAVLLTSPFLLARYAWPHLRRAGKAGSSSWHPCTVSSHRRSRRATSLRSTASSASSRPSRSRERPTTSAPSRSARATSAHRSSSARSPRSPQSAGLSEHDALRDVLLEPQAVKRLLEPAEVADVAAYPPRSRRPRVHRHSRCFRQRLDSTVRARPRRVAPVAPVNAAPGAHPPRERP